MDTKDKIDIIEELALIWQVIVQLSKGNPNGQKFAQKHLDRLLKYLDLIKD